ncbi:MULTISPECIES: glycoside hydrolase family 32 protein [Flavobacteriaceae]|uniref:glycoside hydrolase family 32 protein n=1 Tax=Flavobacteriaceae TaxID=49546 RepID=UPI001490A82F|nr:MULTISPECIES: glycoside hydrolase family 32 protein [Allomuricauda]MDC6365553.1 glycoside hydrolase family 32 protein [Muricauda sp. AC10]
MVTKFKSILMALSMSLIACKGVEKEKNIATSESTYYQEKYRPQYHFSPPEKWMNDPNGLVYHDGIYHLFYQYYPDDIVWGPMHWGHAVSKDIIHWDHKPIALYPDEHGLIFSGSAVVDRNNTSGFAKNGETPLVAIFTYHLMEGEKAGRTDFQTQGIAYSLDNGDTWAKYEGNPVIGNKGIKDFRDPKVFWHVDSKSWIMVLVAGDHAKFYRSKNLKEWVHVGDFGKNQGAHGGVWECPDLFPLQIEETDEVKWVLIISINPGAPNGGSGTQYFIGDFDGEQFISDQIEPKWLDYGTDNYAGVTYNNTPHGDRIFIGWMSNWDYARDTPTEKWRSAMTLPRKLALQKHGETYMLANYPLHQVDDLAAKTLVGGTTVAAKTSDTLKLEGLNQSMVQLKTASKDFTLVFANDLGETLTMTMDADRKTFLLDRMKSGKVDFQTEFGDKKHNMPMNLLPDEEYAIKILLDWSSIEIFIHEGLFTMTDQIFPTEPYNTLIIENKDAEAGMAVESIKSMKSVW